MPIQQHASSAGTTWGLALLFGALGLAIDHHAGGFLGGALLGALLAQIMSLRSRMRSLEQQLESLRDELISESAKPADAAPVPAPTPAAPPTAPRPSVAKPAPPARYERPPAVAQEPRQPRPSATGAPVEPAALERAASGFIAWLKRGNPLARAGIVILFFGAAFLAKYASENSLFPIELRFIALALGACALLGAGWRLRGTRAVYAQLLQGGGIAGLYLTIFAATRLYQLLPFGFALALMVFIALAAAVLAVGQNALALAVIGTAGGFLAPILVSTGGGNHVALFSYYTLLNLGVFAVAWFKTWRVLNVLGFVFTFTITGLWRATGYEAADRSSADLFLILFFVMYVGVSVLNAVRQPPNLKGYLSGSLVFGLPVVAFTLHATLVARIEYALAWSAFALGAFYLALGLALWRTGRQTFRLLVESFAALGVIFASLAIPLAFDTRTTAAMWAVEGAGLLWLGVRQQRKLARVFGTLLQIGAGLGYLWGLDGSHSAHAVLNSAYLGTLMLGISGVFSGYCLYRNEEHRASYEGGMQLVFTLWGIAWWLFGALQEIDRFFAPAAVGVALVHVSITTALLALIGLWRQWLLPRRAALLLPAIAAGAALLHAVSLQHPMAQWGAAGWLALFVAHYAMLRLAESEDLGWLGWLHAGATWVFALLLCWELNWRIEQLTAGVWASLSWGLVPASMLAWLGRRRLIPDWPLSKHSTSYRVRGGTALALALCGWIAWVNLTNAGDPAWLPYVPLLNPLDVCVAFAGASLALWWSSLNRDERARLSLDNEDTHGLAAAVAALAFLWLNSALIRALHHNFGAPLTLHGLSHSTLVQASLSIFWGLLGFASMTLAARRRWRYTWLAGAALMTVVIAKLFLVDLSNVGTIARITSFLTVGALLLVTGYLAPLPPRRQSA